MIKDLTRKATNDKLTTKQVDRIIQQSSNISSSSQNLKNQKINYSTEPKKGIIINTNKSFDKPKTIKTPSLKSKPNQSMTNESYHSSNLENCI